MVVGAVGQDLAGTRTWARARWTHLEVAHGRGGVGEEALAEGDLQTGFLHPLVQVIEGLVAGGQEEWGAGRRGRQGGGAEGKESAE